MNQELFLRDDIIEFNSKLDSQNYNVKAYRKRTSVTNNRAQKKFILSTEYLQSELMDQYRRDKSIDKTQRTTDILSNKRLSATAAVRKRSNPTESPNPIFNKTSRTKHNSLLDDPDQSDDKKERIIRNSKIPEVKENKEGKFAAQEKDYAKKGLKIKHLENWLNQILLEYCHEQKFDTTIENPALKKYGIDKNSLLSKGIDPGNTERIYKTMFVYSMGFNTLLKEISGKNMNIRKTFWKVYAILLQYCSNGDFQTMIGQIQRDKVKKMEIMKQEIQRRQQIIQNNDEINQLKNAKIFKQLKLLREENVNLQNDKNVLMEDYKEAEQAFNQEVTLRLRFQNKINQIHGVHRQLDIKHQKLYDDLQSRTYQLIQIKQKMSRVTDQNLILKNDNQFLKKQNQLVKEQNKFNQDLVQQTKRKYTNYELLEIEWRHKKQQLAIVIRQKEKRIDQIKNQLKNSELMIKLREESEKELQKQYKRSLQQNKQLIASLQLQLQKINSQMVQKKQFKDTHTKIFTEVQYLRVKLCERQQEIKKTKEDLKAINDDLREKIVQAQLLQSKNQQMNLDLKDCYVKIEEMKKIKTLYQQQLVEYRAKQQIYKAYYIQKDALITTLTQKVQNLQRSVSEFNIIKKSLDSRISVLVHKAHSDEEINKKRIEQLRQDVAILNKENKELKEENQIRRAEQEKYANLYEETVSNLKNEHFQRNDLELRYKQSLTVVQSETDHIKSLNIKISEVSQRNDQTSRKIKVLQESIEAKKKTYTNQINFYQKNINKLKEQLKLAKLSVHPMILQDMVSQYERLLSNFIKYKQSKQNFRTEDGLTIPELQAKLAQTEMQKFQIKLNCADQLNKKERQLQFWKEKSQFVQTMAQPTHATEVVSNIQSPLPYSFKDKQKRYLDIIKQKSNRIDELYKQVETMHDQNHSLASRVNEVEQLMRDKERKMQLIQQQRDSLAVQKQSITNQKISLIKEQQKLIVKLNQNQSKLFESPEEKNKNSINLNSREGSRSGQKSYRDREGISREQNRQKTTQPGWRNDFSKKVKNAVSYYNK